MMYRTKVVMLLLLMSLGGGCDTDDDPLVGDRERCVARINAFRASIGLPPYARWVGGEGCADGEAQSDSETGTAHGAFPRCGERAQNECPGWPSVAACIDGCLDMMWAEGPGEPFSEHGHYINMSSSAYHEVACGFHVTASGAVWAVQNFR